MKNSIIILLLLLSGYTNAQQKINIVLKTQLDSVMALDQKYRQVLTMLAQPGKRDSVAKSLSLNVNEATMHFFKLQNQIDSSNLIFIEAVFATYGYPGKSLVGVPTNESAWNIVQHTGKINQYLPIIKQAAESKELPFYLYAMMLDRHLLNKGEEQIYGTQAMTKKLKNGKTESFIWPVKDPVNVNLLRKDAGFDTTVEENAKRFNITYRVVKMEEIK